MTDQRWWIWPRTRVGMVGAAASIVLFVWFVSVGSIGILGMFFLATVTGILWTAIARHGDASLALWLMAIGGSGWLVLLMIW